MMNITVKNCDTKYYPALKDMGYHGLDFSFGHYKDRDLLLTPEYARTVRDKKAAMDAAGLALAQVHISYRPSAYLPADGGNYDDYEAYLLPVFRRQLELTRDLGCHVAVFHPYYELASEENTRAGNMRLYEKLMPLLEEGQIVLALENVYGPRCSHAWHSAAGELLYYTERFDSPFLGVCLDTGHAILREQDPVQMLQKVAHRLAAVHLHSVLPGLDLHTIPYFTAGAEKIDWITFVSELKKTPYTGPFNMELKVPAALSDEAKLLFYKTAYTVARDILKSADSPA